MTRADPRRCDGANARRGQGADRQPQVGVVQRIEYFPANLQTARFGVPPGERFGQRGVHGGAARTPQDASAEPPQVKLDGVYESVDVEPLINGLLIGGHAARNGDLRPAVVSLGVDGGRHGDKDARRAILIRLERRCSIASRRRRAGERFESGSIPGLVENGIAHTRLPVSWLARSKLDGPRSNARSSGSGDTDLRLRNRPFRCSVVHRFRPCVGRQEAIVHARSAVRF